MSISRIANNVSAITANTNLAKTGRDVQKSIERLSSGLRINRAGDDAAGMTIATRLRSQVRGLDRAVMNASDGINLINVAEGAMEEMTLRLDRIRVLAIQAANTGVNDLPARQALQDEVFQSIDEITRIANTTQFGTNKLLNGDFSVDAKIKLGQDGAQNYGINIDSGPSSNTLETGQHFLNIIQTQEATQMFIAGEDDNGVTHTMNTGIQNQSDIAVTLGRFSSTAGLNGTAAVTGDTLGTGGFFNGVTIVDADFITFEGVLSDGVTRYSGVLSASASSNVGLSTELNDNTSLLGLINTAIDQAEMSLFGVQTTASVPSSFRTTVNLASNTGDNRGRLIMASSDETMNQSDLDIRLVRGNMLVTQSLGVTRSGPIGAGSVLSGSGQIGNSVTSITGSTYASGQFSIEVEDVQGAENRTVESNIVFRNRAGALIGRNASVANVNSGLFLNGTFVDGVYTGGVSIHAGDTVTLRGMEADGTTFEGVYSFSLAATTDADLTDFEFASVSGLIAELNHRTRDYGVNTEDGNLTRFESAVFTTTADGRLRLVDDLGRNDSKLNFTLIFNDSGSTATTPYTLTDDAVLQREGFAESATIRINGGPPIRAEAGEVIHYVGDEPTIPGDVRDEVIFRLGSDLSVGQDILEATAAEYVGRLNGGPSITFQNGAQDVTFISNGSFNKGVAKLLTVDFDAILDITSAQDSLPDAGTTLIISTTNRSLNFQIGAFAGENFRTSIGDLSSKNLGFGVGSGRTIENLDVTTFEGANEALFIVDEALDQINRTRSLLGAATNRLNSTIANLSVASENLLTAESRLRDADFARETSIFTQNQVMLQAGTSVLAQANFLPQNFLSLLG
jgi:flagellin